ncbi:MAG TPA: hypothetical protein VEA69_22965 [Tepidisphaeraceae bacterium]|nr:hypothetical protein [Tepidisphaeraceae bacterium]
MKPPDGIPGPGVIRRIPAGGLWLRLDGGKYFANMGRANWVEVHPPDAGCREPHAVIGFDDKFRVFYGRDVEVIVAYLEEVADE